YSLFRVGGATPPCRRVIVIVDSSTRAALTGSNLLLQTTMYYLPGVIGGRPPDGELHDPAQLFDRQPLPHGGALGLGEMGVQIPRAPGPVGIPQVGVGIDDHQRCVHLPTSGALPPRTTNSYSLMHPKPVQAEPMMRSLGTSTHSVNWPKPRAV